MPELNTLHERVIHLQNLQSWLWFYKTNMQMEQVRTTMQQIQAHRERFNL